MTQIVKQISLVKKFIQSDQQNLQLYIYPIEAHYSKFRSKELSPLLHLERAAGNPLSSITRLPASFVSSQSQIVFTCMQHHGSSYQRVFAFQGESGRMDGVVVALGHGLVTVRFSGTLPHVLLLLRAIILPPAVDVFFGHLL